MYILSSSFLTVLFSGIGFVDDVDGGYDLKSIVSGCNKLTNFFIRGNGELPDFFHYTHYGEYSPFAVANDDLVVSFPDNPNKNHLILIARKKAAI